MKQPLPKLIVVDLDDTALTSDHMTMSPKTREVLLACAEKGAIVVPCTGRGDCLIPRDQIPYRYGISSNGAVIWDEEHPEEPLYVRYISREALVKSLEFLSQFDIMIQLFQDREFVQEKRVVEHVDDFLPRLPVWHVPYLRSGRAVAVDSVLDYVRDTEDPKVVKINMVKKGMAQYADFITRLRELSYSNQDTDGHNIELMPPGVSKGNAVTFLAEHLGLTMDEVMVFGDDKNDLSMLRCAGWSVAMKNSKPDIIAAAKYCTPGTNDEDGIADFILEHFEL